MQTGVGLPIIMQLMLSSAMAQLCRVKQKLLEEEVKLPVGLQGLTSTTMRGGSLPFRVSSSQSKSGCHD